MNAQACADRINPNRDSPENEAVRHCVGAAILRCTFGAYCAECMANGREEFQHRCQHQPCHRTLRAIANNNIGVHGNVDCSDICSGCTTLFNEGRLDTRPESADATDGCCQREDGPSRSRRTLCHDRTNSPIQPRTSRVNSGATP